MSKNVMSAADLKSVPVSEPAPRAPRRATQVAELVVLALVPLVLALAAAVQLEQAALLTTVVVVGAVALFFIREERARMPLRELMPVVVLAALGVAGRMAFAAIPDVKPVTAICIIAGALFGRRGGFLTGALCALASNFFFGQGIWTPWQMYAWGLVGYIAGCLGEKLFDRHPWTSPVFGFLAALLYGFILNTWFVVGYVRPITLETVIAAYGAGIALDCVHGAATAAFLAVLYAPWQKKLRRLKSKFGLGE